MVSGVSRCGLMKVRQVCVCVCVCVASGMRCKYNSFALS